MVLAESATSPRGRISSTTSASTSRPSSARPQPPKRAHTSALSTASLRTLTKAGTAAAAAAAAASTTPATATSTANNAHATTPDRALRSPSKNALKARMPHLSPSAVKTSFSNGSLSSSPNYFGFRAEDLQSNPPDSDAGKHAKRNWGTYSGGEGPIDHSSEYESFRKRSEQQTHFNLAPSYLTRFSTDGRVPTTGSMRDAAQYPNGHSEHEHGSFPALSAGGRMQTLTSAEQSYDDEMDTDHASFGLANGYTSTEDSYFGNATPAAPHGSKANKSTSSARPVAPGRLSSASLNRRLSSGNLPQTQAVTPLDLPQKSRASTVSTPFLADEHPMISADDLQSLLAHPEESDLLLLLDLRVSPQHAVSRIRGALNLCIPTTLLKRPAFDIQKLADTFSSPEDKAKFGRWLHTAHIVVYDASSLQPRDAQSGLNTLKKFRIEGYQGQTHILKGGFNTFTAKHPDLVEKSKAKKGPPSGLKLQFGSQAANGLSQAMPVAGGCPMPQDDDQPANPFFGNIRQNMDLVDGVGQMPIKRPDQLTGASLRGLPNWLRDVVDEEEEGKLASERFLEIERTEQKRMQKAYSTQVQYDGSDTLEAIHSHASSQAKHGNVQLAGIEKGSKNRYKDILPYEHTRVRLQHRASDGCDYINASHVKAQWSNRRYIATQAPVPTTFKDFWSLVWEQDVRVIVVLTAQKENGQRKSHPYWEPNTYGHFKVKTLGKEQTVSLDCPSRADLLDPNRTVSMPMSALEPREPQNERLFRRATLMGERDISADKRATNAGPGAPAKEDPICTIRKLALSDVQQPFVPLREVVQIEYTGWPDLGTPAEPGELLSLVEQVDNVIRMTRSAGKGQKDADGFFSPTRVNGLRPLEDDETRWPAPPGERPIIVHCSAGCGRTGTFVTVDSVVDMLKRQRLAAASRRRSSAADQSVVRLKAPNVPGRSAHGDNTFDTAKTLTNLDSIVSPTSKIELNSPKKRSQNADGKFGSIGGSIKDGANSLRIVTSGDDESDEEEDTDLNHQGWVYRDDIDLVQKTVEDLRLQRLSMVQNLRQYTLCYESIIEWLVREAPERFRREKFRQSYQA